MSQCVEEPKNVTESALDHLEDQIDLLRGEVGNITGCTSWVSRPADKTPSDCEAKEEVTQVQSLIRDQIDRLIQKTDESLGLLRKTIDRLEI